MRPELRATALGLALGISCAAAVNCVVQNQGRHLDEHSAALNSTTAQPNKHEADVFVQNQAAIGAPQSDDNGEPGVMYGDTDTMTAVRVDDHKTVVVVIAETDGSVAEKWTFPFVRSDWADVNVFDFRQIRKVPGFAHAQHQTVTIETIYNLDDILRRRAAVIDAK